MIQEYNKSTIIFTVQQKNQRWKCLYWLPMVQNRITTFYIIFYMNMIFKNWTIKRTGKKRNSKVLKFDGGLMAGRPVTIILIITN